MARGRELSISGLLWMLLVTCASFFSNVIYCESMEPSKDELALIYYDGASQIVVTTDPSAYWTTIFKCNSKEDYCSLPVKNSSLLGQGPLSKQTLHFELPRLSQVSEIAFHADIFPTPLLSVSVVRRVSSQVNITMDCKLREKIFSYGIFACNGTHQELNAGIKGDFITVSGVTLGESRLFRANRFVEIMKVRDLFAANNRIREAHQCLEPGKFSSQQTTFSVSSLTNQSTYYQCNFEKNSWKMPSERKCVSGEWSGNVPRCVPKIGNHLVVNQCLISEIEEPLYFLQKDFSEVSSISVKFKAESGQVCDDALKRQITISGGMAQEEVWNSKNRFNAGWCFLAFNPVDDRRINCNNCTILLNLTGVALPETSCIFKITGINEELERYNWLKSGCPPIDPYIGMPVEYADEAAVNHSDLNRRLKEKPCQDGYFQHINTKSDVKQCMSNGDSFEWAGKPPDCRPITCKPPPTVENAEWRYVSNSTFHQVQYTCKTAWELSFGEGIAWCNYDTNEWEGVPACEWAGSNATSCSKIFLKEADRNQTDWVLYNHADNEHEYCLLNEENRLQIHLNRLSQITEIAIHINAITNARDDVIAKVIRDSSFSVTCSYKTERDWFAYFACQEEGAAFQGVLGHTIEIFARPETSILNFKFSSEIIWIKNLYPLRFNEHCLVPGMYPYQKLSLEEKEFFLKGEMISYSCCNNNASCMVGTGERKCVGDRWDGSPPRNCASLNNDEGSNKWIESGCPPIDPYFGMPEEYAGEAAMNSSELNERLKAKPCRDGYRYIERQTSIMQCVLTEPVEDSFFKSSDDDFDKVWGSGGYDGEFDEDQREKEFRWNGEPPKCIPIVCKQPPSLENADWRYVSNVTFREVRYTCRASFKLEKGEGVAKCNQESSEWDEVPSCVEDAESTTKTIPNDTTDGSFTASDLTTDSDQLEKNHKRIDSFSIGSLISVQSENSDQEENNEISNSSTDDSFSLVPANNQSAVTSSITITAIVVSVVVVAVFFIFFLVREKANLCRPKNTEQCDAGNLLKQDQHESRARHLSPYGRYKRFAHATAV